MPARLEGSEGSQECTGHLSGGASTRMERVREEEEDGGRGAGCLTGSTASRPQWAGPNQKCSELHPTPGVLAMVWDSPRTAPLLMLWSQESLAHLERICPLPTLLMTSLVTI